MPLFWFPALDECGDHTGLAHLLSDDHELAVPACGAKVRMLGNGIADPEMLGAHFCKRCLATKEARKGDDHA